MTEARVNRVLQFIYPTLVFLTLVLSWNTVGQARGLADSKIADFNFEPQKRPPTLMQLSCSRDGSDSASQSCKTNAATPWTLLDADEVTPGSSEQAYYFAVDPDPKNGVNAVSRANASSSVEREPL